MEPFIVLAIGFAVWFAVSIIEVLIDHYSTHCFYIGMFNKLRIMGLVILVGMAVAYCGVTT